MAVANESISSNSDTSMPPPRGLRGEDSSEYRRGAIVDPPPAPITNPCSSSSAPVSAPLPSSLFRGLPFVASSSANSGKPGSDLAGREHGAPPASKSQCKQYVARRVKILAEVEASFKRDQPKLAAKAAAATKESEDLKAEVQTLTDQANQLTETDTTGYTQEQIDALNAQLDALMQQRQQDQQKLENTVGPAHSDAEYALRQLVKNHTRDVAGWKGAIKIVKEYCAKNVH